MKRLLNLFCCISAAIFSLSGCFKPDAPKVKDADLLYGYWEVVHTEEDGHYSYINPDGSPGPSGIYDDSHDVAAIKTLNEEEFVLYMDDSGVEEDGLYDIFHQTLTFRRIK